MSEVDDLMVDVMMRGEDDAEIAVLRLIKLVESGELSDKQHKLVNKAIQRRLEKVASGTDLYDFLRRLSKLVNPNP
jgi:hypothetical protein